MELGERGLHPVKECGVVGAVRKVGRVVGHHRIVGSPVRMRLGQRSAGHRDRQLDVIRRIRRDEVHRGCGQGREDREGITHPELTAERIERPRAARVGRAQVGEERPEAVVLGERLPDHRLVDRRPAWLDLEPEGPPRPLRDRGSQERPADAGERIEDELARPGEELDQPGHQAGRLVRPVRFAARVPEFGWVGGGPDRLREVEPLFPGQLVERVCPVRGAAGAGHMAKPTACGWTERGRRGRCGRGP